MLSARNHFSYPVLDDTTVKPVFSNDYSVVCCAYDLFSYEQPSGFLRKKCLRLTEICRKGDALCERNTEKNFRKILQVATREKETK